MIIPQIENRAKKRRMNEEKANVCFMRLKEGRRMEKLIGLYLTIKSSKSNNRPVGLFSFSLSGIRAQRWPLFTSANISTVFTWALSLPHITTCCYWSVSVFFPSLSLSFTHTHAVIIPQHYYYKAEIELLTCVLPGLGAVKQKEFVNTCICFLIIVFFIHCCIVT